MSLAAKTTALSLSPHTMECLKRIMGERFGPDNHYKLSQTVTQLILEECRRLGAYDDKSQTGERERARPS